MASDEKNQWFSRVVDFEGPLCCPRCGAHYSIGPIFDHDPRVCLSCNASLIEWNLLSVTYLVDVERAPGIVENLIQYLRKFGEQEALHQLLTLLQFLQVREITDLYGEK